MRPANAEAPDWAARLKAELMRDKKKTAIMAVLLAVAGGVGGRLLVTHSLPVGVQPAPAAGAPADAARERAGGTASPAAAAGGKVSDALREEYLAKMDRTMARDLFKPSLEYFAPEGAAPGGHATALGKVAPDAGTFQQVEQWLAERQSSELDRAERAGVIQAQAHALSLQSTMLGNSPTALINGQVLRKGDWISGFCVRGITSNSCVVSKDGVDVELRMKN